jgi:predicted transcriptional regulator
MFDSQSKRAPLRGGEEKILEAVSKKHFNLLPGEADGLKFGEITKEIRLSHPTTSDYLKSLQNIEYVEKNVNTRRYCITEKGIDALRKLEGSKNIRESGIPLITPISPLESYPVPFTGEIPTIHGYLSLDEKHKDKTDQVIKKLEIELHCIPEIFNKIGRIFSKRKENSNLKDFVQETKDGVDFDATFLFMFNGRQVANKINWSELMKQAEEQDKLNEASDKKLSKLLQENKEYRRATIKWFLRESLRYSTPSFFSEVASSQKELESNFLRSINNGKSFIPKNVTINEIQDIMEELKKDGILKVVSVAKFVYELDKEKDDLEETKFDELQKKVQV